MMRRATALALAAALVGGILAIPAGPAGAQNGDSLLDAPRLGFEIEPNEGHVGDTVGAQVDPADVEEHCYTSPEEIIPLFFDPDGPGNNPYESPGPLFMELIERGGLVDIEVPTEWPVQVIVPGVIEIDQAPPPGVDELAWAWNLTFQPNENDFPGFAKDTPERIAATILWFFFDQVGSQGAFTGFDVDADYLAETFILTFIDPVTQELVGSTSTFDRYSGTGQLEVPELDPGLWAVAAACVEPVITDESFTAAIASGAEWVVENEIPVPLTNLLGLPDAAELIGEAVPVMLTELMQPRALGIDFYCILQPDGFCETPPDAVGLLEELPDEELAEFADTEAGDGAAGAGDAGAEFAREPVVASPAFTG